MSLASPHLTSTRQNFLCVITDNCRRPSMASLLSFSSLPNKSGRTPRVSTSPVAKTTTLPSVPAVATESLDQKFGRKGIKFIENGDEAIVELSVRNGSSVRLGVADAHVTSYRPKVYWKDDGFEEILYTLDPVVPPVGGDETVSANKARGGIGLVLNDASDAADTTANKGLGRGGQSLLSDAEWSVKDVDSDSYDAVQVELSCTTFGGALDITYVISLYPVSIATAVLVKNNGRKPISITSAILSHLRSKKRGGTAIKGLQGCSYCSYPPLSSPFQVMSPAEAMKADDDGAWFGSSSGSAPSIPGAWTDQVEPFTILKNKVSRVYAAPPSQRSKRFYRTPPSKFEAIDQGKELFYRVIRMGYEDIYVASPGSLSTKYEADYFICTGPASMILPVTISPGETWRGAQVIEHDNLS